jgi:hypothetical protein
MSSVFTKIQKGADLNPKEASRLAVWGSLDSGITKVAPEAKALTKEQSLLIKGAPGLKKNADKTAGIPLLGFKSKSLEKVFQAGKEGAGRIMETGSAKVAPVTAGIPQGNSLLGKITRESVKQAVGKPLVAGVGEATGIIPAPPVSPEEQAALDMQTQDGLVQEGPTQAELDAQQAEQDNPFSQTHVQQAILEDIQTTGGKNTDKLMKLYETFGKPEATKPLKKTEAQRARDEASQLTDTALKQLEGGSIRTGIVGTKVEGVKRLLGKADPETLNFNVTVDSLKAAIAKARAGTSFTPNEERLLNKYAPTSGDTGQVLKSKLQALKLVYQQAAQREYGTEYQPDITVNGQ